MHAGVTDVGNKLHNNYEKNLKRSEDSAAKYHLQVKHINVGVGKDAGVEGSTVFSSPARPIRPAECSRSCCYLVTGRMVLGNAKHTCGRRAHRLFAPTVAQFVDLLILFPSWA